MAEAYSPDHGRSAYKYQYSVRVAFHGSDVAGYFGPATANQGPDFAKAFMRIWGNFITTFNPSISPSIANGASSSDPSAANPASSWPPFTIYQPYQIDLNETGGHLTSEPFGGTNVTEIAGPGLKNNFSLVNAWTWEAGRGVRCDFWRAMGLLVPE